MESKTWEERTRKIKDLVSFAKEMGTYENRLKTFENWPYKEGVPCNPAALAKAGWFYYPKATT